MKTTIVGELVLTRREFVESCIAVVDVIVGRSDLVGNQELYQWIIFSEW